VENVVTAMVVIKCHNTCFVMTLWKLSKW